MPVKFLSNIDPQRAEKLAVELGYLGIYDLLEVLADKGDGGVDIKGHRVVVKVKTRRAGERAEAKWRASQERSG